MYLRLQILESQPSHPCFAISSKSPAPTFQITLSCPLCHSLTQTLSISYLDYYHTNLPISQSFTLLSLLIRVIFLKSISTYGWLTFLFQLILNNGCWHRLHMSSETDPCSSLILQLLLLGFPTSLPLSGIPLCPPSLSQLSVYPYTWVS